jgi:hypothetical protein
VKNVDESAARCFEKRGSGNRGGAPVAAVESRFGERPKFDPVIRIGQVDDRFGLANRLCRLGVNADEASLHGFSVTGFDFDRLSRFEEICLTGLYYCHRVGVVIRALTFSGHVGVCRFVDAGIGRETDREDHLLDRRNLKSDLLFCLVSQKKALTGFETGAYVFIVVVVVVAMIVVVYFRAGDNQDRLDRKNRGREKDSKWA